MNIEDWKKGIEAWKNVKKQAEIDMEQANLYILAIEKKVAEIEKEIELKAQR